MSLDYLLKICHYVSMTNKEIIDACKQYSTRRELRENNLLLLRRAYKRKISNVAFAHMARERIYTADSRDTRKCSNCKEIKPLDQYYKRSGGGVRSHCKECCNAVSNAWRLENKDRSREIQKKCRDKYPEKARIRSKEKRRLNPEAATCRDMLKRILELTGAKKETRTEAALGYSFTDLRTHIESQFKDGMSWENRKEWHIDHIKPVCVFIREGETDPKVINALSNLRPLWAYENLSRGRG